MKSIAIVSYVITDNSCKYLAFCTKTCIAYILHMILLSLLYTASSRLPCSSNMHALCHDDIMVLPYRD